MKTFLKVFGGGLAAILIVIGGLHVFAPGIPTETPALGAVSSADIYSPYLNVNGVYRWFTRQALTLATTTPCAIKSPAATSTYQFVSAQVTVATSTATTWTVAISSTPYATTTQIAQFSLGSGAQGTMVAQASTTIATDGGGVIGPNKYLVWGVQGTAIAGTAFLKGSCQAVFGQI